MRRLVLSLLMACVSPAALVHCGGTSATQDDAGGAGDATTDVVSSKDGGSGNDATADTGPPPADGAGPSDAPVDTYVADTGSPLDTGGPQDTGSPADAGNEAGNDGGDDGGSPEAGPDAAGDAGNVEAGTDGGMGPCVLDQSSLDNCVLQ
jgi:hypothetical protein